MPRHLLLLLLLLTVPAVPAASKSDPGVVSADARWGRLGHRVIARVAAARLSPAAKAEVRRLLGSQSLAAVSTWADEIRDQQPETSNWHYVNIPVWDSVYRPAQHCATGCVILAAETQLARLKDRSLSRSERAIALKWVVHLIQDLHMPLHVGDRGDRGGNDVRLTFAGRPSNLHSVWDSRMLEAQGFTENEQVTRIERRLRTRGDLGNIASGNIRDWAAESHGIARDVVYPYLPQDLALEGEYSKMVRSVLEDRLLRASVRLAALLDDALVGRDSSNR